MSRYSCHARPTGSACAAPAALHCRSCRSHLASWRVPASPAVILAGPQGKACVASSRIAACVGATTAAWPAGSRPAPTRPHVPASLAHIRAEKSPPQSIRSRWARTGECGRPNRRRLWRDRQACMALRRPMHDTPLGRSISTPLASLPVRLDRSTARSRNRRRCDRARTGVRARDRPGKLRRVWGGTADRP